MMRNGLAEKRLDELTVADLWERQAFPATALAALGLSLVFRGRPSDGGGPDYQDAILARDNGHPLHGDVEFHVRSSDWYRHGHHRDPAYDGVLLHVVWLEDDRLVFRHDGHPLPTLALSHLVEWSALSPGPVPKPGLLHLSGLREDHLGAEITAAGLQRFRERADRYEGDIEAVGPDQALYAALLEGLGYSSNRQPFRQLADNLPYAWLMSCPGHQREAILLDAAGLGPPAPLTSPVRLPVTSWRLAGLRPANHPVQRLLAVAQLLYRLSPLAGTVASVVNQAGGGGTIRAALRVRDGDLALLGTGRVDELAASIILPFVAALDRQNEAAACLFRRYPAPPATRWTRLMIGHLRAVGHSFRPHTAAEHQGLHHLYHSLPPSGSPRKEAGVVATS